MALLDLPNELIVQILSYLTPQDLIACQLSNSALYTTIKASVILQFQVALSTFKATDNTSSSLSVSERLQALKASEDAWTFLRRDFKRRIAVNFEVSGIYDLNGGVFLLGNVSRSVLHYVKLPSSIEDDVEWKQIRLNPREGSYIDMGFCLHEHDLLTVVTTNPCHTPGSRTTYDIKIVLFKLSTGEPHPAAKESTIHVLNSPWDRPGIGVEIVGDRLVLILTYRHNNWMPDDLVFVYDWRNAVQTMSFVAPNGSYSGLIFLSESLILIPNAHTNALEIWDIFSTHQIHPACILQFPELSPGSSLLHITCRGEPNPIGSGSKFQSDKPFYQSAHEAIMLFHLHVQLGFGDPMPHQQFGGDMIHTYTLFVHRKALCEIYEQQCIETNSKSEDLFSGTDKKSISVPWSSWGPPITRWFPSDNTNSTRWITTTAGQRGVFCGSHPAIACQYIVLDFNSESLRRAETLSSDVSNRIQCFRHWEAMQGEGSFKEPVIGELPFAICSSESFYAWDGALIDEERVLGLEMHDGRISAIEIHHFGGAQN